MSHEVELKRRIKPGIHNIDFLSAIGKKYVIAAIDNQRVFDAYFKLDGYFRSLGLGPESVLRLREQKGILQLELKVTEEDPARTKSEESKKGICQKAFMQRTEFKGIEEICDRLSLLRRDRLEDLVTNICEDFGVEFILKQDRTKVQVEHVEISLDTVRYHYPRSGPVLRVSDASGEIFHTERIYEAEIVDKSGNSASLAERVTKELYAEGLLGEPLCETKEQIGRSILDTVSRMRKQ